MIIISYDISDDKMRTNFSKMLKKNGAIRLQFSVYEETPKELWIILLPR